MYNIASQENRQSSPQLRNWDNRDQNTERSKAQLPESLKNTILTIENQFFLKMKSAMMPTPTKNCLLRKCHRHIEKFSHRQYPRKDHILQFVSTTYVECYKIIFKYNYSYESSFDHGAGIFDICECMC
jgi:hypothetical protein